MHTKPKTDNQRTVAGYEAYATKYARRVSRRPTGLGKQALDRLATLAGPGGRVLEIGSGPGWDADYLESRGLRVRRTDVTKAFRDLQRQRGKRVGALDLLRNDLGGGYHGVVALYVLQHVGRSYIPRVLRKVARALAPGGGFLVSIQEGSGESWEYGESGDYHVVRWTRAEFTARLAAVGLAVSWWRRLTRERRWLIFLATRPEKPSSQSSRRSTKHFR